jgi:hypothetical protein
MPRYFFNLLFGDRVSKDDEGVELRDQVAAREEASAIIRELSDPALGGNPRRWAGWFLQVADDGGAFMRAPIGHPALELVAKDGSHPGSIHPKVGRSRPQRQLSARLGQKLAELVSEMAARTRTTLALLEQNRRLRTEFLELRNATGQLLEWGKTRRSGQLTAK